MVLFVQMYSAFQDREEENSFDERQSSEDYHPRLEMEQDTAGKFA